VCSTCSMAGASKASGGDGARHDQNLLRVPADKASDDNRRLDRIHRVIEGAFPRPARLSRGSTLRKRLTPL
jgi:hypothetical protein